MARAAHSENYIRRTWRAGLGAVGFALLGAGPLAQAQDARDIPSTESSVPDPEAALQGRPLVAALKRGGYVLYFRHTATDFSRDDKAMKGYADCDNQRPLSAQGRRDAVEVGRAVRTFGLPAGEAWASPYCRTMEHARLMLGQVSPRVEIREAQAGDYAGLKRLLAAPVPAGGNRWIVGHGNPFRAVAGPPHLAEGEAVAIRPGIRGWTVVARLSVADWQALTSAP